MRLLVIGDLCTDIFLYGKCLRIAPEGPVPVFNPVSMSKNKGMAGNVAENLKALGAKVDLISNPEKVTKKRIVDEKSNQLIVRIDENDKVANSFDIDKIDFSLYTAVVVADYDKGFLTIENIAQIGKAHPLTFLDTKKILNVWYMMNYSFIKINEGEWERSKAFNNEDSWKEKLIVTLSEKGAMYKGEVFPASDTQDVKDISGAGDTFLAALVFKYVETKDISEAIKFANICSGIVVKKKGVSVI
jgi:bifunctional ADP-heptose synthase (sugar kinase/adenylyltransferase)